MENEDEFYAEKSRLLAEKEAAEKQTVELQFQTQELILDTQLWAAYREAGGIGADDEEAYQAIKNYLKIDLEDGQAAIRDKWGKIERNSDGTVKSLQQKLTELKQTEGFKGCFSGNGSSSQEPGNSQQSGQPQTFTLEQARIGKVRMDDIASGKLKLEGVEESRKPDTKVVSASEIAKIKKRRWD